jgi:uncharacterized membrane protein
MTEMASILAVLAAGAFGTADFLGGMAARRTAPLAATLVSHAAGFTVILPAVLLQGSAADRDSVAWGALAGAIGGLGLLLFFRAMAAGAMALVAPVTAVAAAGLPVLAGLAAGERPDAQAWIGVAAGLAAVAVIGGAERRSGPPAWTPLALAVAAGCGFGLFFVCLARTSPAAGLWPLAAVRIGSLTLLTMALLTSRAEWRVAPATLRLAAVSGILDMSANLLLLLALRRGLLTLVAVLVSLYPAATVGLAVALLGERPRPAQVAGVGLALAAVGLIAAS